MDTRPKYKDIPNTDLITTVDTLQRLLACCDPMQYPRDYDALAGALHLAKLVLLLKNGG